ncbi:MAG: LysR family transcriptional regulator [Rhizobiaceae bacterium]|nr:LysR family transcriptional regulator [Rhizobiaceae bacterium]
MDYPRRSIPSVSGLIAFEATARHLSFSRAAEELALTQGAVSKRVRQLEAVLGFQLLLRNTNQVCLTDIGQRYLGDAVDLLRQLHNSTEDIRASARGMEAIRIAAPTAFAIRWLMPKMIGFSHAFPNCLINIVSLSSPDDPKVVDADCLVFDGQTPWRDSYSTTLVSGSYTVVASASYTSNARSLSPRHLANSPLLGCNQTPDLWQRWFSTAGLSEPPQESARFDDLAVLIEATLVGQGVALLPDFLIADDIRTGRLRRLFPDSTFGRIEYNLAVRPSHQRASVQAFVDWLDSPACNRFSGQAVRTA